MENLSFKQFDHSTISVVAVREMSNWRCWLGLAGAAAAGFFNIAAGIAIGVSLIVSKTC